MVDDEDTEPAGGGAESHAETTEHPPAPDTAEEAEAAAGDVEAAADEAAEQITDAAEEAADEIDDAADDMRAVVNELRGDIAHLVERFDRAETWARGVVVEEDTAPAAPAGEAPAAAPVTPSGEGGGRRRVGHRHRRLIGRRG